MPLFLMRPLTENYEITYERNFEPTKYPRQKILDQRNTHKGTMARDPRWHATHETHDDMRPTKFSTLSPNQRWF